MLGLKKFGRGFRSLGQKVVGGLRVGAKSLHKVANVGNKIGGGLNTIGTLTGQPEILALGSGIQAGSEVAKRGASFLEKV